MLLICSNCVVLCIGIGLSAFGSALATVFLFKPQSVSVSIIFLTVISYAGGLGMETCIPNKGFIGKWFNPHPFNAKEHLAIVMLVELKIQQTSSETSSASN